MRATSRFWSHAAVGGALAGLAILFHAPLLLVGTGGLGAYLIARQYAAYRAFAQAADTQISFDSAQTHLRVEQQTSILVVVVRDLPAMGTLDLTVSTPPGITVVDDSDHVLLQSGIPFREFTLVVEPQVAGEFEIGPAVLELEDSSGLFTETLAVGPSEQIRVDPSRPDDIHVGQAGTSVSGAYGDHAADRRGGGIEPRELREYLPGDPAGQIDWRATARLQSPHVVEFEAETDRPTLLVLDDRDRMHVGPTGRTMLDYARAVGLGIVGEARERSDPLSLVRVADDGSALVEDRCSTPAGYRRVADHLRALEATGETGQYAPRRSLQPRPPARRHLRGDSAFETTLQPYSAWESATESDRADTSLDGAVERAIESTPAQPWCVIVTSDRSPQELRSAVGRVVSAGGTALVFLLPELLFQRDGFENPERTYTEYLEFEQLRRDISRDAQVTAFEVGPGDRLRAVLRHGDAKTSVI